MQSAGLSDGIPGRVGYGVGEATTHQVMPAAIDLHPLHHTMPHGHGHVPDKGILRLVVVVVTVERTEVRFQVDIHW